MNKYSNFKSLRRIAIASLAVLFTFSINASAQTAREIMDRAASKLEKAGGMQVSFETTMFSGTKEQSTTRGTIQISGQKFCVASQGADVWFDGKTQWTLLAGSDEVNVTAPTKEQVQKMNPYYFVNLYKSGYTLQNSRSSYQGKGVHKVDLTATSRGAEIQRMTILLSDDYTPLNVRLKDKKGNWMRFRISSLKTRQSFSAATFQYKESNHPGVEVIDLR